MSSAVSGPNTIKDTKALLPSMHKRGPENTSGENKVNKYVKEMLLSCLIGTVFCTCFCMIVSPIAIALSEPPDYSQLKTVAIISPIAGFILGCCGFALEKITSKLPVYKLPVYPVHMNF
ncbi:MAG: hypothetical protein K1060chlam3_00474 [Candidatus Anoxychlamydiales bacterium]|nr:hypothetical protein [Candidatus Anoxychlamydiales bacterium]